MLLMVLVRILLRTLKIKLIRLDNRCECVSSILQSKFVHYVFLSSSLYDLLSFAEAKTRRIKKLTNEISTKVYSPFEVFAF